MNIGKIINFIRRKTQFIYHGLFFSEYGNKSVIIKPDRIIGKKYIHIGRNVSILHHARIECVDAYAGEKYNCKLVIGDNTSIEERCHIIAADNLSIGSECMISADVYISDCGHGMKQSEPYRNQPLVIKPTKVGNHCFIGFGARIMPGVKIGNNCIVGANAVVTHDVPDGAIVAGIPAKIIGYGEK